jgi:hypothetical protein
MHEEITKEMRKAALSVLEIQCLLQQKPKRNINWGVVYDAVLLLAVVYLLVLSQTVCSA